MSLGRRLFKFSGQQKAQENLGMKKQAY